MNFKNRFSSRAAFFFVCIIAFFSSTVDAQMQIDSFAAATNDRFANDPSFIGAGFDFSGVGRAGWGTLISPNVIITANHAIASGTIRFNLDNDPAGPFVDRQILNGQQIGDTDIYVARLNASVPSSYKIYDFAREEISGTAGFIQAAGSFQGDDVFMVGRSPTVQGSLIDVAIGENVITGYVENGTFGSNTNNDFIFLEYNQQSDGQVYQTYESHVNSGDSSAPLFVEDGSGNLLLLGVNTARFNNSDGSVFGSGISYTGNVADEIDAFIAVSTVPEPTSLSLLLGATCLFLARRKRAA